MFVAPILPVQSTHLVIIAAIDRMAIGIDQIAYGILGNDVQKCMLILNTEYHGNVLLFHSIYPDQTTVFGQPRRLT